MNALARFSLHTRLTLRYILALGMVALLTLTSYALMDNAVRTEVLGARLLNVAGRQRMLCQRVEILVMRAADDAGDERKARLQELDAALRELEQGHRLLAHGSAQSLGLAADSPVIEILRGNEDGVEALYHDFIDQVGTWRAVLAQGWGMDAQAVLRFRSSGDARKGQDKHQRQPHASQKKSHAVPAHSALPPLSRTYAATRLAVSLPTSSQTVKYVWSL